MLAAYELGGGIEVTLAKLQGQGEWLLALRRCRRRRGCEQLVGDACHGGDDDDGLQTRIAPRGDDGCRALHRGRVFDRGAAELHDHDPGSGDAHAKAPAEATHFFQSSLPSMASISAFRIAAPAAPRMVLCESSVELPIEQRARAQATDRGGHAVAAHQVQARLRTIDGVFVLDGLRGRGGQWMTFVDACKRAELCPGGEHLLVGGGAAELDADALGVTVVNRDAIAVRAERGIEHVDVIPLECAEQLAYFFLQLLFFVLDERDDVAEDVERGDAGIACAGDGLHGADEELLDAELLVQRLEGEHEADGAAVGVGDDVAAGLPAR